ncbi:MAG TPA: thioesterase family protein [Opitutaceae bacterium]|jgi:1,4-dihydroxy-2-naphthoyl-CoA hydrolase
MSGHYERPIRIADLDGAGFVYFAHYLSFCHEAYEAALMAVGIDLRTFFVTQKVLLPIGKAQVQFLGPLTSGNRLRVELARRSLSDSSFRLDYRLVHAGETDRLVALAQTEHVAMDLATLERRPLPADLVRWLAGSAPA